MLRLAHFHPPKNISRSCSASSFESIIADSQTNTTLKEFCKNYSFDFRNFMDFYEAREHFFKYLRNNGFSGFVQCHEDMEKFQKLFSVENRYKTAVQICNTYMTTNPTLNNTLQYPSNIVDTISKTIQTRKCSRDLFDPAMDHLLQQMQTKFFIKFLDSSDFVEFIKMGLRKHGKRMFDQLGQRKQEQTLLYKPCSTASTPYSPKPLDDLESISVSTFDLLSEDCPEDSPTEIDNIHEMNIEDQQLEELDHPLPSQIQDESSMTNYSSRYNTEQEKGLVVRATLIQFQKQMDHKCINDAIFQQDFDMFYFMASEDPLIKNTLYKPHHVTENYASYICKVPFLLGHNKSSYFLRTELIVPYEYDKVALLDIRHECYKAAEANLYDIKLLDILPVDLRRRQFARAIYSEKVKIGFPFDDRYLVFACCAVDDSQRNQRFTTISQSCKYVDKQTGQQIIIPKCVLCMMKGGKTIIPLPSDSKKCKIIEAYCMNLSTSLSSELIAKMGASRVTTRYKKLMNYLGSQFTPTGKLINESITTSPDSLRLLEVVKDNQILL